MTPQVKADLSWLIQTHQVGTSMGLTDKEAIEVAETQGDIEPEAMRLYKEKYK